jgi:integrase/recombinase XerD
MTEPSISPLRQRMLDDMAIRRFKPRTQDMYVRAVAKFAQHFRTSPDKLDFEHVRAYQLHLVRSGFQAGYIRQTMTVLRFFYKVTLRRPEAPLLIPVMREAQKLRAILSPEEVARFIAAAPGCKYRCAFVVAYGAGLRVSEIVALKVSDVDSAHMVLRIQDGKGRRDRLAKLSPMMLEELRAISKQSIAPKRRRRPCKGWKNLTPNGAGNISPSRNRGETSGSTSSRSSPSRRT